MQNLLNNLLMARSGYDLWLHQSKNLLSYCNYLKPISNVVLSVNKQEVLLYIFYSLLDEKKLLKLIYKIL